jgi:hypothetical protein
MMFGESFVFPPDYGVTPCSTFHSQHHPPSLQVALSDAVPYDTGAPSGAFCTQVPVLIRHTCGPGAIKSGNCARGDQDGEDSKPHMPARPSSHGTNQFVQFVPPTDEAFATSGETPQSIITRDEFNHLVESYITSLARKNREKALMSLAKYSDVLRFLEHEAAEQNSVNTTKRKHSASTQAAQDIVEATSTSSSSLGDDSTGSPSPSRNATLVLPDQLRVPNAVDTDGTMPNKAQQNSQFRVWAKKNFVLRRVGGVSAVTHNKKLVAVQEQLYDILVYCHKQTNHGGRDKTNALVTKYYVREFILILDPKHSKIIY